MEKVQIKKAVEELLKNAPKRKFSQSIDLIINLKDINLKKPEEQLDLFVTLPHKRGKEIKVAAFVGPELVDEATKECNTVIKAADFKSYDPKKAKKLASENDMFIAQANVMKDVAVQFGRVFGPRNKMPNPKAGAVVAPSASLKPLVERLQKVVRVTAKKSPVVHVMIAKENQPMEEIVNNIHTTYNYVMHALPKEKNNIKNVYLKLTMSKPVKV